MDKEGGGEVFDSAGALGRLSTGAQMFLKLMKLK
jgi:hypothetical protein